MRLSIGDPARKGKTSEGGRSRRYYWRRIGYESACVSLSCSLVVVVVVIVST